MPGARKALAIGVAVAAVCTLKQHLDFVPGPRHAAPVAAATAAGVMMAPAAFADEIGDAAKKLGDASYDFAKEVDWNNGIFLQAPGKFQPLKALKASILEPMTIILSMAFIVSGAVLPGSGFR